MLAFAKEKKSFGLTLLITLFGGWLGAHRFYLGHNFIGGALLACTGLISLGFTIAGGEVGHPAYFIAHGLISVLTVVVFIEIILSFWVVGRENERIKFRLADEFDVKDYRVSK